MSGRHKIMRNLFAMLALAGCGRHATVGADADPAPDHDDVRDVDSHTPATCAGPGSLDMSFGVDGATIIFGSHEGGPVLADSVVVDAASRIIVVGGFVAGARSCVVARLLPDGSKDLTFGANGVVRQTIGDDECWFNDVALQADGKIVAFGEVAGNTTPHAVVARYLPDGTLDPTFGDAGLVVDATNVRAGLAIAIDQDQRIAVVGQLTTDQASAFDTRRLLQGGESDSSFGTGGSVQYMLENGPDGGFDAVIQSDGQILVAGVVTSDLGLSDFSIVRYASDGTKDPAFGAMGAATIAFGTNSAAGGIALDTAGRSIVVGGAEQGAAIVRLTSDGRADDTFANGGTLMDSGRPVLAYAAVVTAGTNFVAVGNSSGPGTTETVVARYTEGGVRDTTFGTDGFAQPLSLPGLTNIAHDLTLQSDGRILVVGGYGDPADYDMFVARYCP